MAYKVLVKKKQLKSLKKLPIKVLIKFELLVNDLKDRGPIQTHWANYSKLGEAKYHCHLSYSWVACWQVFDNELSIEVYYVGSREKAPY